MLVIDKKLFSRAIKDKKQKADEKPLIDKLDADHDKNVANIKYQLIEKLFELVNGRTSQGVSNIIRRRNYCKRELSLLKNY